MNIEKSKIVIVTSEFPPQPGGIGNHAYNLALYLSKNNFQIQVIADQRSKMGAEEICFDKSLPFDVVRIKRHDLRLKMYISRLRMTKGSFKNASCVIATGKFSLWNVAFFSKFYKCKTLAVIHGTEVNFKPYFLKKSMDVALKQMDVIVAVSNYTKNLVSHLNRKVNVIANGIDVSQWKLNEISPIELIGKPILTTVGRVSSRKGQLNVIKKLPELIKDFPEIHYHCVGIPTEADDFLKIADQLGVQKHITFHGSVNEDVLKEVLAKTDVFVMLSSESKTGDVEGFGIAILEANAMGIPAIGSKGCGIEDAIKINASGQLIDVNDSMQFKEGIEAIIKDKLQYQKESKHWAEQHDWSNIIKQYIVLIDE